MIAIRNSSKPDDVVPEWHHRFLALVPAVRRSAEFSFRKLRPDLRKEMVDEVVVNALVAFARLVKLGREELAFPSSLAEYAVKQVRRLNIRDVSSRYAQQRKSFQVERLDQFDSDDGEWREVLVEDKRCSPADLACCRIDFGNWLATMSSARRKIAQCLATGTSTREAAHQFDVTPGRISQLRREFQESWLAFHGETVVAAAAAA